jgi:hypothetical protein
MTFLFFRRTLKNILYNITYIENEILEHYYFFKLNKPKNPYDNGKFENLKETLGSPFLLFLVGKGYSDGYKYKRNYEIDEWPPII